MREAKVSASEQGCSADKLHGIFIPSNWYLVWFQDNGQALTREDYLQRGAQLIDGRVLAGDASFKYAKVIRLPTGSDGTRARPVYGIFTIMNEYDQV